MVKVKQAIISNETGLPTGQYEFIMVKNTFNPQVIIAIILGLCVVYFCVIYWPAKMLFYHLENKY